MTSTLRETGISQTKIVVPGGSSNLPVTSAIGHVCVQWSRLEMTIFALLISIEPMEWDKATIMFGGLDLLPRVNIAIALARHEKLPIRFIKRIEEIRRTLQKDGLSERRNQVVHGAHRDMENFGTTLTMLRWKGERRSQTLSANEINEIAEQAYELGDNAWHLIADINEWDKRQAALGKSRFETSHKV
jgi:hypothetical protein